MSNRPYKNVKRFADGLSKEIKKKMHHDDEDADVNVVAPNPELDLFGKVASDLQKDLVIAEDTISATLKYVSDYTGFSSKTEEQSGNYIAISVDTDLEDATLTAQLIKTAGTKDPVVLDSDKTIVFLVKSNARKIKVTASNEEKTIEKEYALDLTLEKEGD